MKKPINSSLFLLSFIFYLSSSMIAQQPAWIDYAKRTSLYPESDYLIGYVSAHNTNNEDPGKLMDQYEELAKSKVIQSIQVSIETNNSLLLSNENGKSGEKFESKSVSFSSATITGLRTERYYDAKKKNVYAFAFANKKELAYYNRKLITTNLQKIKQKLNEGREHLDLNDKQNALKSFYEGMPLLAEAEEAQWLLMAINREQFIENDMQAIRENKFELNKEISSLQQSSTLNINEAAYFIAYGLFVQLSMLEDPIIAHLCTYENTELPSDFSEQFDIELKKALVKTGNYKIFDDLDSTKNKLVLKGNYWEEGNQLRVHVQILKNNKLEAMAEGSVSRAWLKDEQIIYLPPQLEKIDQLGNFKLKLIDAPEKIKIGRHSDQPVILRLEKINADMPGQNGNIPILINTIEKQLIAKSMTNPDGLAEIYFPAFSLPAGKTEFITQVDLASYVDIDTNSAFYGRINRNNPVTPAIFSVDLVPLIYYVNSIETIDRKPVEIKIIEPDLKNVLADKGYQFVNNEAEADYEILIKATTTAGNTYQGIYFSYVDATMSVIDLSTGMEAFKTSVEQIKGGGSNSKKAGIKALNLASDHLKEKMIEYLSSH